MSSKPLPLPDLARPRGVTVRLYLADGTPDGLKIVEKSNWTGRGLMFPRAQTSVLRERKDFERAGVYVLIGPNEEGEGDQVYIGEADPLRDRLSSHAREKDFWTRAVAFTSTNENLNKAHVQYLEARLVSIAKAAKRAVLLNGNAPQLPNLSEPDQADVEMFLTEMLLIYPLLGVRAFESATVADPGATLGPRLHLEGKGVRAEGRDRADGFVVYAGGTAVFDTVTSAPKHVIAHRDQLVRQGVLVPEAGHYRFAQDYVFSSPSAAAMVVYGRSSNGRTEWKDPSGRSLKELQDQALA